MYENERSRCREEWEVAGRGEESCQEKLKGIWQKKEYNKVQEENIVLGKEQVRWEESQVLERKLKY